MDEGREPDGKYAAKGENETRMKLREKDKEKKIGIHADSTTNQLRIMAQCIF